MLYVRKGLFSSGNAASGDELTREFYRAADSISSIDHMMIKDASVDRNNFVSPSVSTRAPSSTHRVTYTPGGGAAGVLNQASAVTGANPLADFADVGNATFLDVTDGTAAENPLRLNIFLADVAKVLVCLSCQYVAGNAPQPNFITVDVQMLMDGEGGRLRSFSTENNGFYQPTSGLSLVDSFTLPPGDHVIRARARERSDPDGSNGVITAMTLSAVGFYR